MRAAVEKSPLPILSNEASVASAGSLSILLSHAVGGHVPMTSRERGQTRDSTLRRIDGVSECCIQMPVLPSKTACCCAQAQAMDSTTCHLIVERP